MVMPFKSDVEKGPIRILCEEIGLRFHKRLETPEMLVAFVAVLVSEVDSMRRMSALLAERIGSEAPSGASDIVLTAATEMLGQKSITSLIEAAGVVHSLCHEHNPDDAYPTDHVINMLSGCASAIRFGLETPCRSRHAASAAEHIWSQRYGISLFDEATPRWERDWARAKFVEGVVSLVPLSQISPPERR
jgi:hypothetical protein